MRTTAVASDRRAANKSSDSFVSCMVEFTYSWIGVPSSERMWHCSLSCSAIPCVNCFAYAVINIDSKMISSMQLSQSFEKWQFWNRNNRFRHDGMSQTSHETQLGQTLCGQCVDTQSTAKHV